MAVHGEIGASLPQEEDWLNGTYRAI